MTPATVFKVLDTGLQSGSENLAFNCAQLEASDADPGEAWLRFYRFEPTASIGEFERVDDGLRRAYCESHGIGIIQRLSGGGALYHDPGQLVWNLTFRDRAPGADIPYYAWLVGLCEGAAEGLRRLGIDARFSPPNDIEVGGRKLASGFLGAIGETLLFQGYLFVDGVDIESMLKVLRQPKEKLTPAGVLSARGRFVTLRDCGATVDQFRIEHALMDGWKTMLGFRFTRVDVAPWTRPDAPRRNRVVPTAAAEAAEDSGACRAFVRTPGGVLQARVHLSADRQVVDDAVVSGGVHVFPMDLFGALRAALRGSPAAELDQRLSAFFRGHRHDLIGLGEEDVHRVLRLALARPREQADFDLTMAQANTLMVNGGNGESAADIVRRATVMLVPYCAKPASCKWRTREGCAECGLCEVGDAYRLACDRGMRAITITNYEHLCDTLDELRREKVPAYVGMCCGNFFIKRHEAFRRAGIPAVLLDISGSNCYELQQEDLAYQGRFEAKARIDLDVLTRVLRRKAQAAG